MRRRAACIVAVVALSAAALAGCGSANDLVGPTWQWTGLTENVPKSQSVVPHPESYTIEFADDGTFEAQADCNRVSGTYTAGDDSLKLDPGLSTRAACPADSLSDMYVNLLRTVTSYSISSERMTLGLAADAGEMEFHEQP